MLNRKITLFFVSCLLLIAVPMGTAFANQLDNVELRVSYDITDDSYYLQSESLPYKDGTTVAVHISDLNLDLTGVIWQGQASFAIARNQANMIKENAYSARLTIHAGQDDELVLAAHTVSEVPTVTVEISGMTGSVGLYSGAETDTTVGMEDAKFLDVLAQVGEEPVIKITSEQAHFIHCALSIQNINDLQKWQATVELAIKNVAYRIPARAIDTKAIETVFPGVSPSDIQLHLYITPSQYTVENALSGSYEFIVTASHGEAIVDISTFITAVTREMVLPDSSQFSSMTTAVVLLDNGNVRHVPTKKVYQSGKGIAKINSFSNSVYALIANSASFEDIKGKWYEGAVTEMASRMIVFGDNGAFHGDIAITKAEFTAMLVRAMGLPMESTAAKYFTDITPYDWYYHVVGVAYEYGLIQDTDNLEAVFAPNQNITREEAMVMLFRAAALCGLDTSDVGQMGYAGYFDVEDVSSWADSAARYSILTGLMQPVETPSGQIIQPQGHVSRGEAATVILRFLQKADYIDVRTQV